MEDAHRLRDWLGAIGAPTVLKTLSSLDPSAAVFMVDAQQNVVHWSHGAEALLGFTAAEMVGAHCLKGNRCEPCIRGCGVREHGVIDAQPLTLHGADGAPVEVRKSARAFYSPTGEFLGAVELLKPAPAGTRAPSARSSESFHGLITRDPGMLQAFEVIRNVAETDASVLLRGESGTGKELAAQAIHDESLRRDGPMLAINCAALSPNLLESELFGHVRGAFTGALRDRQGLFERANGGTLLLDEVAELPLDLQAKLLRVLQEQRFHPVGGNREKRVDVRILAATHRGLRKRVREGRFREDLMFRLRVVPIFLPPLRERRGDVELLLWHFIEMHNRRGPRSIRSVHPEAMRALLDYRWPGNVRELLNVVQYAFAVGRGPELLKSELPPEFREASQDLPANDQAGRIRQALASSNGNISGAAKAMGVSRATFWRMRKRHGL